MVLNERQEKMIEYLKSEKHASVRKLSSYFFVSEMTVRRDLKELNEAGYIKRYRGGAVYSVDDSFLPVEARKLFRTNEKDRLSKEAKKYLSDSKVIFIDSSSTCMYIIPLLSEYKEITVITNSVQNLLEASKYHIRCIFAGGDYYEHDMCTVGSRTEEFLRSINADIAFFSALGISDDGIISDSDFNQTAVRKTVMKNCKKNIFLFDSTKQHKKYAFTLCRSEEAGGIIIL